MLSSTVLICLACGGCFACLLLLIGNLSNRHADQANERLQSLAKIRDDSPNRRTTPNSAKESARAEERGSAAYFKRLLHQLVPNKKSDQLAHQSRLFHAGIYHPSALWRYFACKLLLMIAPPLLGWFAGAQGFISLRFGLLLGGTAGAFGMILPSLWLDRRIKIRHKQLRRSLPDFLDLMIVCLDGGLSLQGAIQRVSDEFQLAHPILAREMQTVQRDVDLGATIEVSLRNLAERTGLDSLRTLSSFVR